MTQTYEAQKEPNQYLQFAFETSKDSNAYTPEKTICEIIETHSPEIKGDTSAFLYSVFPELKIG